MDATAHSRRARATPDRRNRHSADLVTARSGFTVLELLTVFGIVSLLAAIVLPALGATREAAHRIQCASQLRQIGIAVHCYHDGFRSLPPGVQWETTRNSAYGWSVPLLPYLDQHAVYLRTDRNRTLTDPANAESRQHAIPLLVCPSDVAAGVFDLYVERPDGALQAHLTDEQPLLALPFASYVAVFGNSEPDDHDDEFDDDDDDPGMPGEGAFVDDKAVRLSEFVGGLSNTMWVSERTAATLPSTWLGVDGRGEDALCRLLGNALNGPNCRECDECEFSSRHEGGVNVLFGDGRVELVPDTIDLSVYRRMARRDHADLGL